MTIALVRLDTVATADLVALMTDPRVRLHMPMARGPFVRITAWGFGELGLPSVTILLPPTRGRAHAVRRLGFVPDGETEYDGQRFLRYRLHRR